MWFSVVDMQHAIELRRANIRCGQRMLSTDPAGKAKCRHILKINASSEID